MKTSCVADTNDANGIVTGGNGVTLSGNNARTTSVSKTFTLRTASTASKLCILIPASSGGSGKYSDTGLVVEIRGTARYLVVSTAGYGFLAGSSPTAATTAFVIKISTNTGTSGLVSSDEEHGVTQVVATLYTDPQTVGTTSTLSGTATKSIVIDTNNGVITWTDLKINYWGNNFRIRFTATTITGTSMSLTTRDSAYFTVGGIAKSLNLLTAAAGCVAGTACTTQPVIQVLDGGGSVLSDLYSGIQTITTTVQIDTGCEHSDSQYSNQQTIPSGTTCTVSSGVCTYSNQKLSTWANGLVLRYTATLPTAPVHTMTSSVTYVDSAGFVVKGTAAKIVLTFDLLTWVANYSPSGSSVKPTLTAPQVIVKDASNNEITDSCVSGVPKVTTAITSGTSNSGTIGSGSFQYSRSVGTGTFTTMSFSTFMSDIVVTFTAVAPTHAADMAQATQVTAAFDVYVLMYQRKVTMQRHINHFNNPEDRSEGTLQVATP